MEFGTPLQAVTLVPRGGTPVTLCDQFGNPYPTTGYGALVFNQSPQIYNLQLSDVASTTLNITSLRSTPVGHDTMIVQGYYILNDGGGGTFFYDTASLQADDGGTVIKPDSVPATSPGRWVRYIPDGVLTPLMFGAFPNTGVSVKPAMQQMMTAANDKTIEMPAGRFLMDAGLTGPANVVINSHNDTWWDWSIAPLGAIWISWAGSLTVAQPLSTQTYQLTPAKLWLPSPATYAVNDRVSYVGINYRCLVNHTASTTTGFPSTQAAFYSDLGKGYWEQTNFQTTSSVLAVTPGAWIALQSPDRFDSQGYLNYRGETVQVLSVVAQQVNIRGIVHANYAVPGSTWRQYNTMKNITVQGGNFTGRPMPNNGINNQLGLHFNVCENVRVKDVNISECVSMVVFKDAIQGEVTGCNFFNGQGLAYATSLSNGCVDINIHHNRSNYVRHFFTASADTNRAPPRHTVVGYNYVNVSRRYLTDPMTPSSPLGGTGDAIDTHPGMVDITFIGNTILNASGSGIHVESQSYRVIDNTIDGCDIGVSCGNNTVLACGAEIRGNTIRYANTYAVSVRIGTGQTGGYNRIDITDNKIFNTGSTPIFVSGQPGQKISNINISRNTIMTSAAASSMILVTQSVAPVLSGNIINPSTTTQACITLDNYEGAVITGNVFNMPALSVGTALILSNVDNSADPGKTTNTGNGTIVLGTPPVVPGTPDGVYRIRCTIPAPRAGTFAFFDLDGNTVGTFQVGAPWTTFVNLTLTAGTIDYVVGDGWDLPVTGATVVPVKASGNTGKETITIPAHNVIGRQFVEGIGLILCTSAATPGAELWSVLDPASASLGTATTGVPFTAPNGAQFTIIDNTPHAAVGDSFSYTYQRGSFGAVINDNYFSCPTIKSQPGATINRAVLFGDTTSFNNVGAGNDFSQAYNTITFGAGGGHSYAQKPRTEVYAVGAGAINQTWNPFPVPTNTNTVSAPTVIFTGAITVDRSVTLTVLNMWDGATVTFRHQGVTAFHWSIGGLINLASGQSCTVQYSAALGAWVLLLFTP